MVEKTETTEETKSTYASDQLALKIGSVIARDLHEGDSIVLLRKAWDSKNEELIIVPTYADQDPMALKPDVWMPLRHELKRPISGHTHIRDYAKVMASLPVRSAEALKRIDHEHALSRVEAVRLFEAGEPGLVAVVLRVYHLPRSYRIETADTEGEGELVRLPFDVETEGATPALDDEDFERRFAHVEAVLAAR